MVPAVKSDIDPWFGMSESWRLVSANKSTAHTHGANSHWNVEHSGDYSRPWCIHNPPDSSTQGYERDYRHAAENDAFTVSQTLLCPTQASNALERQKEKKKDHPI